MVSQDSSLERACVTLDPICDGLLIGADARVLILYTDTDADGLYNQSKGGVLPEGQSVIAHGVLPEPSAVGSAARNPTNRHSDYFLRKRL
eukprot:IDg730t1